MAQRVPSAGMVGQDTGCWEVSQEIPTPLCPAQSSPCPPAGEHTLYSVSEG